MRETNHTPGKTLAVWGLALQTLSSAGILFTILMMISTFDKLASSGAEGTQEFAINLSDAQVPALIGSLLGLIGTALMLVAFFKDQFHPPWFRGVLWVFSILWLFSFPVGTIIGVMVIIQLNKLKDTYREQAYSGTPHLR